MGDYRRQNSTFGFHNRDERNRSRLPSEYDRRDYRQHPYRNNNEGRSFTNDQRQNRFHGYRGRNDPGYNNEVRNVHFRSAHDDPCCRRDYEDYSRKSAVDTETVKLMERLRGYTTYLVRRKREIIEQNRQRELEEEIDEIDYCMDVIKDSNADTKFGLSVMKTVHNKVLELVRNNPINKAFSNNYQEESDEDDLAAAPRSPSPVPVSEATLFPSTSNKESIRLIPMERSNSKPDWNYNKTASHKGSDTHRSSLSHGKTYHDRSQSESQRLQHEANFNEKSRSRDEYLSQAPMKGSNVYSGATNDCDYRESDLHQNKSSSDFDYRVHAEPRSNNIIGHNRNETDNVGIWNENNPFSSDSERPDSIPSTFNPNIGINPPPGLVPPAIMTQMLMGLQLTPQQQQFLAMNIVQNQPQLPQLFGPFPQQPSNRVPQLNNSQHALLQNIPPPPLRSFNPGLVRPARPPLLPTPPRMPSFQPRFDPTSGPIGSENSFRPPPREYLRNPIRSNDKYTQQQNIAMQFRQKAANCFANNQNFLPNQNQNSFKNTNETEPVENQTTEKSTESKSADSNQNSVRDPRLKPRVTKTALSAKPESSAPSQIDNLQRRDKDVLDDISKPGNNTGSSSQSKVKELKEEAVKILPVVSTQARRISSEKTTANIPENTKDTHKATDFVRPGSEKIVKENSNEGRKTRNQNRIEASTSRIPETRSKKELKTKQSEKPVSHNKHSSSVKSSQRSDVNRPPCGSMLGFRIPKIKKPEPEPESQPPVSSSAHEESQDIEVLVLSDDDRDEDDVVVVAVVEAEGTAVKNNNSIKNPDLIEDLTPGCVESVESTPSLPSNSAGEIGVDTDVLLRDYLEKSLSDERRAKMSAENWAKLMDSLKCQLNAKLDELSDGNLEVEDPAPATPDNHSTASDDIEKEEVSNEDIGRKSRSIVKKKNSKRRSSLEKLHDALREMGFDSFMPRGPRRTTGRISCENILEPAVVEAVVNQLQTSVVENIEPLSEAVENDGKVDSTKPAEKVKKRRGRKRKKAVPVVAKTSKAKTTSVKLRKKAIEVLREKSIGDKEDLPTKPTTGTRGRPTRTSTRKGETNPQATDTEGGSEEAVGVVTRSRIGRKAKTPAQGLGKKKFAIKSASEEMIRRVHLEMEGQTLGSSEEISEILNNSLAVVDSANLEITLDMSEAEINAIEKEITGDFRDPSGDFLDPAFSDNIDIGALNVGISSLFESEMERSVETLPQPKLGTDFHEMYASLMKENKLSNETERRLEKDTDEEIMNDVKKLLEWVVSTVEISKEPDDEIVSSRSSKFPETIDYYAKLSCDNRPDQENSDDISLSSVKILPSLINEASQPSTSTQDLPVENMQEYVHSDQPQLCAKARTEELSSTNNSNSNESWSNNREQRIINLEGHSLYKCGNEMCSFTGANSIEFRDHTYICGFVSESKQVTCFHCDKRIKSITSLLEHLKIHGCQKQICSLCSFRCWINIELVKHMKVVHKVNSYKIIKILEEGESEFLMYPKDVWAKLAQPNNLQDNMLMYAPKVQYSPGQWDLIPKASIFPSVVHCGLCKYSTKVRSNLIRHLHLHEQATLDGVTKVPDIAPVNPVPYLERKELMFDKMTNWAGSSHMNKEKSGISGDEAAKLPQFVLEQFRYICSVLNCKQITCDDSLLRSHMKALHSDVESYVCPHCQHNEFARKDPRNTVSIDKIGAHLKLHGSRLLKCGHCDHIHISTRIMERHVSEKHPEKKPIHYVIRNLDTEGNHSNRRSSVDELSKNSSDRWRCTLCRALSCSWEEAKSHCESTHGIDSQFVCSSCRYGSTTIVDLSNHLIENTCSVTKRDAAIMIMFSRNECFNNETKDESACSVSIWRRNNSKAKHIRGIYLEETKEVKERKENKEPKEKKAPKETKEAKEKEKEVVTSSPVVLPASPVPKVGREPKINLLSLPSTGNVVKIAEKLINTIATAEPVCQLLICPKCNKYKTKNQHDFVIHLHNEFQYKRYRCRICKIGCVTLDSLKAHVVNDHNDEYSEAKHLLMEPINKEIEEFVTSTITAQSKELMPDLSKLTLPTATATTSSGRGPRPLEVSVKCKHCELFFSTYHNYKTHLIAKHLAPERFKCSYCPLGFWSEGVLKLHHGKIHPEMEFKCVLDNELEKSLTPEFWQKEYGIPHTKWTKGGIGRVIEENTTVQKSVGLSQRNNSVASGPSAKTSCAGKKKHLYSYMCYHCKKPSASLQNVRNHWTRFHKDTTCSYKRIETKRASQFWVCSCCSFTTAKFSTMKIHFNTSHRGRNFNCTKEYLNNQYKINLSCACCNFESDGVLSMNSHFKKSHPTNTVKYSNIPTLLRAEEKVFEDKVSFECKYCKEKFAVRDDCLNHTMTYHGEPMSTVDASVVFTQKEQDLDHTDHEARVKAPNKPRGRKLFGCPKCDFSSPTKDEVRNHLHEHVFAFACSICDVHFKTPSETTFHFRHDHASNTLKAVSNNNVAVEFSTLVNGIVDLLPCPVRPQPQASSSTVFDFVDEIIEVDEHGEPVDSFVTGRKPKRHPTARKSTSGVPIHVLNAAKRRKIEIIGTSSTDLTINPSQELQTLDLTSVPDFKYDSDEEFPFFLGDCIESPSSFDLMPDSFEWTDVFMRNTGEPSSSSIDFVTNFEQQ